MGLRIRQTSNRARVAVVSLAVIALALQPAVSFVRGIDVWALAGEPDLSKISFTAPRYVRENNAGDMTAQLKTDKTPTDVKFYIDDRDGAPLPGTQKSLSEWRLYTALSAGKHAVFADVKIGGEWYELPGQGTVYSLDTPNVSYTFPNEKNDLFRPGDNPMRVKIDDEFEQFEQVYFELYHYDKATGKYGDKIGVFNVARDHCDLRAAGRYVLCDIDAAVAKASEPGTKTWQPLLAGTYAAKLKSDTYANNGVRYHDAAYWSHPFTVDSVSPVVTDFKIEGSTTVGNIVKVAAKAEDDNQLESVNFYVTRPREDGACTGNGTKLAESRATYADVDGYYRAALNVAGGEFTTGTYCVNAVARDGAMGNSGIARLAFVVDHTPPAVSLRLTSKPTMMASSGPITLMGTVGESLAVLKLTNLRTGEEVNLKNNVDGNGKWSYAVPSKAIVAGEYSFSLYAEDAHGNHATETIGPVTVTPYVPGAARGVSPDLARPLDDAFVVPRQLPVAGVTAPFTANEADVAIEKPEVLGTQTEKDAPTPHETAAIAASEDGWKFFGIAWYWWTLAVGGLGAASWWAVASLRQRFAQDVL